MGEGGEFQISLITEVTKAKEKLKKKKNKHHHQTNLCDLHGKFVKELFQHDNSHQNENYIKQYMKLMLSGLIFPCAVL